MREKEKLLELLDDPDIINKLKKRLRDSDNFDSRHESERSSHNEAELQMRIAYIKKECEAEANRKLEQMRLQYEALLSQMQSELNKEKDIAEQNERVIKQIEEKYRKAESIYAIYSGLDDVQLKWFDRVLHNDNSQAKSPIELIVWATQKDNLISLWEIIASHMSQIIDKKQNTMFYTLFEECFNLYAATTRGRAFLITPGVGAEYDPLKHSKTAESRSFGRIIEVILPGYCVGNENNKPIVRVE